MHVCYLWRDNAGFAKKFPWVLTERKVDGQRADFLGFPARCNETPDEGLTLSHELTSRLSTQTNGRR